MSSKRKGRLRSKLSEGSIFLDALPVFWDLEMEAQSAVFRLLKAQKTVKKDLEKLKKKMRGKRGT